MYMLSIFIYTCMYTLSIFTSQAAHVEKKWKVNVLKYW